MFGKGNVMDILNWMRVQLAGLSQQRQVREELSKLSDRNLADIGLSRGDIDGVARQARHDLVALRLAASPSGKGVSGEFQAERA